MDIRKKTGLDARQVSRIAPFFALLVGSCLMLLAGCKFSDNNSPSTTSGGTPTSVDNNTGNSGSAGNSGGNASSGNNTPGDNTSSSGAVTPPIILSLSWMPTPGQIDGYIIHTGPSPESATSVLTVTAGTTVEYDAVDDLGLSIGDQACFRIKAYNAEGQSGFSDAICYTVSA